MTYACSDACSIDVFDVELSASQLSSLGHDTFLNSNRDRIETPLHRAREVKGRTNAAKVGEVIRSIDSFVTAISDFENFIVFGIADDRTSYVAETHAALRSMKELLRGDIQDRLFQGFQDIHQCYFYDRKPVVDNIKHAVIETGKTFVDFLQLVDYLKEVILPLDIEYNRIAYSKWDSFVALLEKLRRLLQESVHTFTCYSSYVTEDDDIHSEQPDVGVENSISAGCLPRHVFARENTTRRCAQRARHVNQGNEYLQGLIEEVFAEMGLINNFLEIHGDAMTNVSAPNITLPDTRFLQLQYDENITSIRVTFDRRVQNNLYGERNTYLEILKFYVNCLARYENCLVDISDLLETLNRPIKRGISHDVHSLLEHAAKIRSWLNAQIARYARNETTKQALAKEFTVHGSGFIATSEAISKEIQQFIIGPLQALIREEQEEVEKLYGKGLSLFWELSCSFDSAELRQRPRKMTIWTGPLPDLGSSQVYRYINKLVR